MNKLVLKEATQEYVIYWYQPQGEGEYGEIKIKSGDENAEVLSKPSSDEDGYFAHKACRKVKECFEKKNLPMNFIQAWY
ncbi:MAG: hypothetical protein LBS74_08165 [Oscillospiraceae bacterium]|jgi:hypothetical protein|nr:hypothetical protein [Oscillospiraceae bacterium]